MQCASCSLKLTFTLDFNFEFDFDFELVLVLDGAETTEDKKPKILSSSSSGRVVASDGCDVVGDDLGVSICMVYLEKLLVDVHEIRIVLAESDVVELEVLV